MCCQESTLNKRKTLYNKIIVFTSAIKIAILLGSFAFGRIVGKGAWACMSDSLQCSWSKISGKKKKGFTIKVSKIPVIIIARGKLRLETIHKHE